VAQQTEFEEFESHPTDKPQFSASIIAVEVEESEKDAQIVPRVLSFNPDDSDSDASDQKN